MRMPGEPPRLSPIRTVIVSPGERNPRATVTVMVRDQGRIASFGLYSRTSFAPFEASAET